MADNIVTVTCCNPECNHKFRVKHPGKAAKARYSCPACHTKVPVIFKAPELTEPVNAQGGFNVGVAKVPASQAIPGTGAAPKAQKEVPHTVMVGDLNSWTTSASATEGIMRVWMHRRLLPVSVKDFPINAQGIFTIGREDPVQVSSISITGDPSVSRRSVLIEPSTDAHGTVGFRLKVLNTKNPVYVNGMAMYTGDSIQLSFGDDIVMGQTNMKFIEKK